ncbi:hypothetical protein MT347_00485 [Microbacterium sp. VKM Ac-2923]|nr:hypothetical protein [Microbacterium sp. VKM Ac-2923]MCJ1706123.1 hypothetical protein [Microbacterium sp. VKM Ac-2923]
MSPHLDVVVRGEALVDIVTTSAGAAERPGGSPAAAVEVPAAPTFPPLLRRAAAPAAITVGRKGTQPPTREDLQRAAAPKESA